MAFTKSLTRYSRVPIDTESQEKDPILTADNQVQHQARRWDLESEERSKWHWVGRHAAMLFACAVTVLNVGLTLVFYWSDSRHMACLESILTPSPALKDLDNHLYPVKFNGTLDHPSIYRQDPSPEVDAAWDALEDVQIMSISEEELLAAGQSTDSIRLPEKWGGGYMASLEVNHQLHCLNFLRKNIFADYYKPRSVEWTDEPEMFHTHLLHCVEMLRQFLMCKADVGVIAHKWVKDYPRPYPDFNTWHQCRDWDQVIGWAKDHELPGPPDGPEPHHQYKPEPGAVIFENPP